MNRREFLRAFGGWAAAGGIRSLAAPPEEFSTDVLVVGGGLGGCAAALALASAGRRVVLASETNWLGGQGTTQAAPPDEHPWIETQGCTRTYRTFRDAIRAHYRAHDTPILPSGTAREWNPGDCWVSRLGHEPRVSADVLEILLYPSVSGGQLRIFRPHEAIAAEVVGDRIRSITLRDLLSRRETQVRAKYVIDATELGDLLPLVGAEWVIGAESQSMTQELHAPSTPDPLAQQAFTWAIALEHQPGRDHRADPPPRYSFWRDHIPATCPEWPGPLLGWDGPNPATLRTRRLGFNPVGPTAEPNLWTYRRIRAAAQFRPRTGSADISVINWPQNDYFLGPLVGVSSEEAATHREGARELTRCLVHWLQTEAPRPDGGMGWPGLRPCAGVLGTDDGFALAPYLRESRRILAEFTLSERHIGVEQRRKEGFGTTAESFNDSVGVGAYRIDLHPTPTGDNYLDLSSFPFQIPLGALLPARLENLLPAAKNMGTTHITNGCCRVHPVEWNVGEAAGHLAAWCLGRGEPPRYLRNHPRALKEFQNQLVQAGVELAWAAEHRTSTL